MNAYAIGLCCKSCKDDSGEAVYVDIHHAYLEKGKMYIQGDCSECQTAIRFSCDDLLISLMSDPKLKGNEKVQ